MSTISFQRQMERFADKVRRRERVLYDRVNDHVGRSIKHGSAVTGAPGQPVRTGALLASWRNDRSNPRVTRWFSNLVYAPIIEDNRRGAQLRSKVGGFHSVKMTRHGFLAIVRHELRQLTDTFSTFDPKAGRWRDASGRFTKAPVR